MTNPSHPLDGARLKLARAQVHLQAAKVEIRRYLDTRPFKRTTYRAKEDGRDYPDVVPTSPPPSPITELVGDCLGALRCPLDYIAWELASRHFAPSFTSETEERGISFPIYKEPGHKTLAGKLKFLASRGIPPEAIKEIEAVQPYHHAYRALWLLSKLVNADKHRTPSLTAGTAGTIMWVEMGGRRFFPAIGHEMDGRAPGGNAIIPVYVAFGERGLPDEPLHETLEKIIHTVSNVIGRFDQFF